MGVGMLSAGYLLLWVAGYHIAGLIVGVIVLDIGQQSMQIANQTAHLQPRRGRAQPLEHRLYDRLFPGGAAGSALSTIAWAHCSGMESAPWDCFSLRLRRHAWRAARPGRSSAYRRLVIKMASTSRL